MRRQRDVAFFDHAVPLDPQKLTDAITKAFLEMPLIGIKECQSAWFQGASRSHHVPRLPYLKLPAVEAPPKPSRCARSRSASTAALPHPLALGSDIAQAEIRIGDVGP